MWAGGEVLSEIIGHVDSRDRPIVSLTLPGQDDSLLVIVDTGFNGQLLIRDNDAARLNCGSARVELTVEMADRRSRVLKRARGSIFWFGRQRNVDVWLSAEPHRAALPEEPVGLLGTGLLSPHRLTIDFASRRAVINEHNE
jgi:predicted aspartyl protease